MSVQKSIHKLKKFSTYSYSETVSKEMIYKYGWNEHQKLVVTDKGNDRIEIRDWRKK